MFGGIARQVGTSFAFISIAFLAGCARPDEVETRTGALTSADILGFEATSGWTLTQGTVQSITLTTTRTKGANALALTKPSGYMRIESAKLASTTPDITKIERGASAALDFMIPTEQVGPYWTGAVQMYVSVPSKNMYNAYLGQVELTGQRTAVYSTLRFKIPDATADIIKGATFSDLTFGITVNVPLNSPGVYRLDNLRIKGKKPPAPTDETQITPGQSILLVASKAYSPASSTPASQTFTQGVIQIPASFHTVTGGVGTGSATFEYTLGTAANVVCQYTADATTGKDYKFSSCANGAKAGDLVPATFVRLTIVNGNASAGTTKVRAQIALNPVEDDLLGGLPPLPTYFGTTAAEVAASLDAFVQAQRNWQVNGFVRLHLPTPAIPVQDSVILNGTALPPTRSSNTDPQYGISGRLTGSDLADAGWHANGSIDAPIDDQGTRNTTFDLDIGADVFLLGGSTKILGVTGHAETHTPAPSAGSIPPTTGFSHFCAQYFGVAQSCKDSSGTVGLNQEVVNATPHFALPSINYWIFSVGASIDLSLKATLTGGLTPNGLAVAIEPIASVNASVRGGLSVGGFIGAGLFVTAQLVGLDAPISASITASLNLQPGACSITVSETLAAKAILTAGGGTIGYYVEGGICCGCFIELCWRDEGNIYSWPGYSHTFDILPETPLASQTITLDTATVCPSVSGAPGQIDYPTAGETFNQGDVSFMKATFKIDFGSSGGGQTLDLDKQVWTTTCSTDSLFSNGGIKYGDCPSRTLHVDATNSLHPEAGSGSASVTVNVNPNDPTTAPVPSIGIPGFNQNFETACGHATSVNAIAHVTDPNFDTHLLTWYSDKFSRHGLDPNNDPGTEISSGVTPPLPIDLGVQIIRLIAQDDAGHKALVEIPINVNDVCVK
jgi:hypothetical protein